jgi:alanine dehydrogenase
LGLVGCGRQAVTQWRALSEIFSFREARVMGKDAEESKTFCATWSAQTKTTLTPCATVEEACAADIVVTTTPSRSPIVKKGWIKPGTHINAIGADAPGKQEIEGSILKSARVVVDLGEQAFHSGEVNVPLAAGVLKPEDILGNLGSLIIGRYRARQSDADITIFDSTGLAVQDVSVGSWVYEKARSLNRGQWLDLF